MLSLLRTRSNWSLFILQGIGLGYLFFYQIRRCATNDSNRCLYFEYYTCFTLCQVGNLLRVLLKFVYYLRGFTQNYLQCYKLQNLRKIYPSSKVSTDTDFLRPRRVILSERKAKQKICLRRKAKAQNLLLLLFLLLLLLFLILLSSVHGPIDALRSLTTRPSKKAAITRVTFALMAQKSPHRLVWFGLVWFGASCIAIVWNCF